MAPLPVFALYGLLWHSSERLQFRPLLEGNLQAFLAAFGKDSRGERVGRILTLFLRQNSLLAQKGQDDPPGFLGGALLGSAQRLAYSFRPGRRCLRRLVHRAPRSAWGLHSRLGRPDNPLSAPLPF